MLIQHAQMRKTLSLCALLLLLLLVLNDMSGLCLTSSAAGEPLTTGKCKVAAN